MFPLLFCAFLALIPILWLYSRWSEKETLGELARRNVPYVAQPNIFLSILRKERLEEPKHALIAKHGNVFGFRFLGEYTILIAEPDIAQQILSKEFATFTNRRVSLQIFNLQNCSKIAVFSLLKTIKMEDSLNRSSMFLIRDEQWKRLRSVITPTFSVGKLRQMKPFIDDTIRTLIRNFEVSLTQSSNANVKQLFGAYTMDTVN